MARVRFRLYEATYFFIREKHFLRKKKTRLFSSEAIAYIVYVECITMVYCLETLRANKLYLFITILKIIVISFPL